MKASIKTIMDGVVHDNKQVIKENGGNAAQYLILTAESLDQGWLEFMTDEEAEEYENASAERREEIRNDIRSWINENYNYNLRSEELLEKWIVVRFIDSDPDNSIFVTRRSNFVEMLFCHAYSDYGQTVSCDHAGCYSLSNSSSQFKKDLESFIKDKFKFEGEFSYDEHIEQQEEGIDTDQPLFVEIDKAVKEWVAENERHTNVTAWTYHDSHNFKTVVLEADDFEPDCVELEEDDQIEILLQMPETAPHMEGFNTSVETEDYIFRFDRWATNPWFCNVERK